MDELISKIEGLKKKGVFEIDFSKPISKRTFVVSPQKAINALFLKRKADKIYGKDRKLGNETYVDSMFLYIDEFLEKDNCDLSNGTSLNKCELFLRWMGFHDFIVSVCRNCTEKESNFENIYLLIDLNVLLHLQNQMVTLYKNNKDTDSIEKKYIRMCKIISEELHILYKKMLNTDLKKLSVMPLTEFKNYVRSKTKL